MGFGHKNIAYFLALRSFTLLYLPKLSLLFGFLDMLGLLVALLVSHGLLDLLAFSLLRFSWSLI